MATKYGLPGAIFIDNKELAYMSEWSLEQSKDIQEASFFRGKGKEKTVGIGDWTASCNGRVDFAQDTGHLDVQKAFEEGKAVQVELYLNAKENYAGEAFIESLNISNSAEGEWTIEISLTGNGGIKYNATKASV